MPERPKLNAKEIGARLKELRTAILKISLVKMYDATGVPASGISTMERGFMKPSAAYLHGLVKLFDVNINWVLTGKGAPFKPDIEIKLDHGADNETIKEMFYAIENIPAIRYELLKHFLYIKDDSPGYFNPDRKKK